MVQDILRLVHHLQNRVGDRLTICIQDAEVLLRQVQLRLHNLRPYCCSRIEQSQSDFRFSRIFDPHRHFAHCQFRQVHRDISGLLVAHIDIFVGIIRHTGANRVVRGILEHQLPYFPNRFNRILEAQTQGNSQNRLQHVDQIVLDICIQQFEVRTGGKNGLVDTHQLPVHQFPGDFFQFRSPRFNRLDVFFDCR